MSTEPRSFDFTDPNMSPFMFDELVPADPQVPTTEKQRILAWPYEADIDDDELTQKHFLATSWQPISDILYYPHNTDLHYAQYLFALPRMGMRRLRTDALEILGKIAEAPAPPGDEILPRMGILAIDVDSAEAHKAAGGVARKEAPLEWRESERLKIERLQAAVSGTFVHESRGGYRVLLRLPHPFKIADERTALLWSQFYVRALAWLARKFDIVGDPKTKPWVNLFRAPRATRSDKGPEDRKRYGDPHALGQWPYLPNPGDFADDLAITQRLAAVRQDWRESALNELVRRPTATTRRAAPAAKIPMARPSASQLTALESALAAGLRNIDDGRHPLYLALAGSLLDRGTCANDVPDMIHRIALAAGDPKASDRRRDAATTASAHTNGKPTTGMPTLRREWPQIASVIDQHLPVPEARGVESLREQLARRPAVAGIPLHDVDTTIARAIGTANDELVVIRITPGAGKTHAAAATAVGAKTKFALSFPLNELARDQFVRIRSARPQDVQRRFGLLSARDAQGEPICKRPQIVDAVQRAGLSPSHSVCRKCDHKASCPIAGGIDGAASHAAVIVTNHDLVPRAVEFVGKAGTLVLDESPQLFEHHIITAETITTLSRLLANQVFEKRTIVLLRPLLRLLETLFTLRSGGPGETWKQTLEKASTRLAQDSDWALVSGGAASAAKTTVTRPAADAFGWLELVARNGNLPPLSTTALKRVLVGDRPFADQVGAIWATLRSFARTSAGSGHVEWEEPQATRGANVLAARVVSPNPKAEAALARRGPTLLLDATADVDAIRFIAKDRPVRVADVVVNDGARLERVIRYWPQGSRHRMLPGGKCDESVVSPVTREGLDRARAAGVQRVLVVSYHKAIPTLRRLVREDKAVAASGLRVHFAHYGAIRGMNVLDGVRWEDLDAIITLGDPWPQVAQVRAEARVLGLDETGQESRTTIAAEVELMQVFGRIRAPRRTRPALLLHYGRVLPLDWHSGNAQIELRPTGRPSLSSAMDVDELKKLVDAAGGGRALARLAGNSEGAIRHYLAGRRPVPAEAAAVFRDVVGSLRANGKPTRLPSLQAAYGRTDNGNGAAPPTPNDGTPSHDGVVQPGAV